MAGKRIFTFNTISEFHEFRGFPKPEHPLISVIDVAPIKDTAMDEPVNIVFNFYLVSMKTGYNVKMKYGQQEYDFNEGVMSFMAPGQVFSIEPLEKESKQSGWVLLIHPDFLWNTLLAKKIRQYQYFDYSVNEALFLSDKEKLTVSAIVKNIKREYHTNIDQFSQEIIIAQLESLLAYAERFYQRQFITRKISNHRVLEKLEVLLTEYFNSDELVRKGLPSVKYISTELNVSANYLSNLLKVLTGKSTQQHIQDKVIEKAKEQLSTTALSVSEIAYGLGFYYPQSFSKLFKAKTHLSPLEFRQSFN
jgi:AraC-like DNA-binding protein